MIDNALVIARLVEATKSGKLKWRLRKLGYSVFTYSDEGMSLELICGDENILTMFSPWCGEILSVRDGIDELANCVWDVMEPRKMHEVDSFFLRIGSP